VWGNYHLFFTEPSRIKKGGKVVVIGLVGLGRTGIKIAHAMGAKTTMSLLRLAR